MNTGPVEMRNVCLMAAVSYWHRHLGCTCTYPVVPVIVAEMPVILLMKVHVTNIFCLLCGKLFLPHSCMHPFHCYAHTPLPPITTTYSFTHQLTLTLLFHTHTTLSHTHTQSHVHTLVLPQPELAAWPPFRG